MAYWIKIYNDHQTVVFQSESTHIADLDRVFEQFYRVEKSRAAAYGGSGLGLSIVKRIIELHSGRIALESEPSAWTRVNIFLPQSVD